MPTQETMLTVTGPKEQIAFSYPIYWEENFLALPKVLAALPGKPIRKVCVVSDAQVAALYLPTVTEVLTDAFSVTDAFVFPPGEDAKTLETVSALYSHLLQQGLERNDLLVALGGGVTGDLTGFAAATYRRGIRFAQIPTTLLAQVDSSIGGKTGVDLYAAKNMVGAFHQPSLVYMALSTLDTLPIEQWRSGMSEVIKTALISDAELFSLLETESEALLAGDRALHQKVIQCCCKHKAEVVREDPLDTGRRAILNFGHTIGHAIESCKQFSWLHGQCVAVGMVAATRLSVKWKGLSIAEQDRILRVLALYGLPETVTGLSEEEILAACRADKKNEEGALRFVLLENIGRAVLEPQFSESALREAIDGILS